MMKEKKTVFKFFTIPEYNKEEQYLSAMHREGWRLTHISLPGFYHFEKCEPEQMAYRLDYNPEGIRNKAEYIQMFSDCGWEYLFDFVGYSYFRKAGNELQENEEIFCDDASRLDMMKRVFRGRVVPLIIIFFCVIIPQLLATTFGYGGGSIAQSILSICFVFLASMYLSFFLVFAYQLYQYEKKLDIRGKGSKAKFIGVMALIGIFTIFVGVVFYSSHSSKYDLTDTSNGFSSSPNFLPVICSIFAIYSRICA